MQWAKDDGAGEWQRTKRTKTLIRAALLIFTGVVLALIVVETNYPGLLFPPSSERRAKVVATLTTQIRKAYGPTLETVDVRYGRQDHRPTFFTSFRLKGVPFTFSFTDEDWYVLQYDGSFSRLASPELIGGAKPFVALAQQFHRDFPAEKSMAQQRTYAGNLPAPLPQLAAGMKPTVLVYGSDADVGDLTKVVGVYAWDGKSGTWRLLHRGPLPEPSSETQG